MIEAFHHASLVVSSTEKAVDFYQGLLGLPLRKDRPEMGFAGAWLDVGAQQLHLLELPNPDPVTGRPSHGGRDRHLAFSVSGLDNIKSRLTEQGVDFTMSRSGRAALFCRDPDGNAVELIDIG